MKLLPPEKWTAYLRSQPETGMGYVTADIILENGSCYSDVIINGGYVTKVRGLNGIPFEPREIKEIIITHKKWNWSE